MEWNNGRPCHLHVQLALLLLPPLLICLKGPWGLSMLCTLILHPVSRPSHKFLFFTLCRLKVEEKLYLKHFSLLGFVWCLCAQGSVAVPAQGSPWLA